MRKLIAGLSLLCGLVVWGVLADAADEQPAGIQAAAVELGRPVDFDKDVLPILESKCIACHNIAIDEGKLSLEDVESVLKGGKRGPAVVAKDPDKSRLFQFAARAANPAMPPLPNKVDAVAVTPQELGLIRQWILEGAEKGMGGGRQAVQWQPLPSSLKSIYSVALSPWARFAAAGRANQISVYDLSSNQEVARLADPALNDVQFNERPMYPGGAAHRDFVNSLAFSPDGNLLASGGFRVVKLWKRTTDMKRFALPVGQDVTAVAVSADGKLAAVAAADNSIRLWNLADGTPGATIAGHTDRITALDFWPSPEEQTAVSQQVKTAAAAVVTATNNLTAAQQALADFTKTPDPKLDEAAKAAKLEQLTAGQTNAENALKASQDAAQAAIDARAAFDKKAAEESRLYSSSLDKTVRIWKAADGSAIGQLETPAAVNDVTANRDGSQFITAGADNVLRSWAFPIVAPAAAEGAEADAKPAIVPLKEMKGHGEPVTSVDLIFTPGTQIVSGSTDRTVRTWDLTNGNQVRAMDHGGPVLGVAARGDGLRLASISDNGIGKVWQTDNGAQIAEFKSDVNLQRRVAERTEEQSVAKQRFGLADAAFKAAEQNVKDRDEAQKKATEAKDAADKAIAEPETKNKEAEDKLAAAKTAQVDADKALKAAQEAAAKSVALRDEATKKAAADAELLKKAQEALTAAQKTAADTAAAEKTAADAKAAADKGTDEAAKEAAAKALTDAQAAAKKAADELAAAQKAATDADAVAKASAEAQKKAEEVAKADEEKVKTADAASKAAVKPTEEAQKAFDAAQAELKKVKDAQAQADRSLVLAQKAVETAKTGLDADTKAKDAADAYQKQLEAEVAQAAEAEKAALKPLRAVAFSADGFQIFASGDDMELHVFDGTTGTPLEAYVAHQAPVTALAVTAAGVVVSGSADKTATAWTSVPEWTLFARLGASAEQPLDVTMSPFVNRVLSLDFSPDGKLLATGGGDPSRSGELMIWDVEQQAVLHNIADAHSDTVMGVEFSRDGSVLVSGAADKFVKTFEVASGKHIRSYEGHTHHVLDVTMQADMSTIVSAGADNAIKCWNTETGEQRRTIASHTKQVIAVQYIGPSDNFVSCGGDQKVQLIKASNGSVYRGFGGGTDYMYAAACSRDEAVVVAGGEDGVLRVWNAKNGQAIVNFEPPQPVAADNAVAAAGK